MNEMRTGFEEFDHTADVGIRIYAASFEELLVNAARGMFSLILPEERRGYSPSTTLKEINTSAEEKDMLLQQWLSELLYIHSVEKLIPSGDAQIDLQGYYLRGIVPFMVMDGQMISDATEIKAVTFHDLEVNRLESGWYAQVIFDT